MLILFLAREGCAECEKVRDALKNQALAGLEMRVMHSDTVDGMAEAAFFNVRSVPQLVIVDDEDNATEIGRHIGADGILKFFTQGS